jgi:hypothetical protein
MVQIVDIEMAISLAGKAFSLSGKDSIIIPAHLPHALKSIKSTKRVLTSINN